MPIPSNIATVNKHLSLHCFTGGTVHNIVEQVRDILQWMGQPEVISHNGTNDKINMPLHGFMVLGLRSKTKEHFLKGISSEPLLVTNTSSKCCQVSKELKIKVG